MPRAPASRRTQNLVFVRTFFRRPRELGSFAPSSRFLVDRLLRHVDWARVRTMVEYGPGVGNFTVEILRRMGPEGRLLVMETNPTFVRVLRETVDDPRLHVAHRSAAEAGEALEELELPAPDYVLSGIPFSLMPREQRVGILERTRGLLEEGNGTFLVYQFRPAIVRYLREVFPRVRWGVEPLNLPPAVVLRAWPDRGPAVPRADGDGAAPGPPPA